MQVLKMGVQQPQPQPQQGTDNNKSIGAVTNNNNEKKWYRWQQTATSKNNRMQPQHRQRPHLTLFACLLNCGLCVCLVCYLLIGAFSLTVTEQHRYGQQPQTQAPLSPSHQHQQQQQHIGGSNGGHTVANGSLAVRFDNELLDTIRDRVIERIWEITVSLNILYRDNWTRLAAVELRDFQNRYTQLMLNAQQQQQLSTTAPKVPMMPTTAAVHAPIAGQSTRWRLPQAFLYCLLLLTTTGLPNVSLTFAGKLITTIFIGLGVPLMILCLSAIGSFGSKCVRLLMFYGNWGSAQSEPIIASGSVTADAIDTFPMMPSQQLQSIDSKLFCVNDIIGRDVPMATKTLKKPRQQSLRKWHVNYLFGVLVFFGIYAGFLAGGYFVLRTFNSEFWTFFECFYFSFLTLTTISFGSDDARMAIFEAGHKSDFVFWFCSGYVFTGLGLLSTFFYVINDEFLQFF